MKLERFTDTVVNEIVDKNIYFVGYTKSYLRDFEKQYPGLVVRVREIICLFPSPPPAVKFANKEYALRELSYMSEIDFSSSCIIIMHELEQEAFAYINHQLGNKFEGSVYWYPNILNQRELCYRESVANLPLENMILFRSGPSVYFYGMDFSDNSRALFEYMLAHSYNKKWKLVWLVHDPESPEYDFYKKLENVSFIGWNDKKSENRVVRERYYEAVSRSKFIFSTEAFNFAKNTDSRQIRIQLWHGCGIKGRKKGKKPYDSHEWQYDYTTVISNFYAALHKKYFHLREDQVLVLGYPKDDLIYNSNSNNIRELLRLPKAKHYVLWAPTFRKVSNKARANLEVETLPSETGLPVVNTFGDMYKLNALLCEMDVILVIKLHPAAEYCDSNTRFSNIIFFTNANIYDLGLQINSMMPLFEAFISDYSSAAISFLLLNRPMAFTLDDLELYERDRGFAFTPVKKYLPGVEIYHLEEFFGFITDVCKGKDTTYLKRKELLSLMHAFDDGKNCQRILDYFSIKV